MMVPARIVFVAILATQAGAPSQVQLPPRDGAAGRGRISGVVVGADGTPIAGATLTLQGSQTTSWKRVTATSDARGQFVFSALSADLFNLEAAKSGYLKAALGAVRSGGEGTAIALAASQRISDLVLTLSRGGVITGTVRDATGHAAPGLRVALTRVDLPGIVDDVPTDAEGKYRLEGLPPGNYIVLAMPQFWGASVPVFHPSAISPAQAASVRVGAGDVRERIDIALVQATPTRIAGVVLDPAGRPAVGAMVFAIPPAWGGMAGPLGRETGPKGEFLYDGVFPGRYAIRAHLKLSPDSPTYDVATQWAAEDIEVPAAGILPLTLRLQPSIPISGRVTFDSKSRSAPADLTDVRVSLERGGWMPTAIDVRADGTFERGLGPAPGSYDLDAFVTGAAGVWWLRSAIVNGRDLLDEGVELSRTADLTGIALTFTDRHNRLFGAVTGADGAPVPACFVIVFPADRDRWARPYRRRMTYKRPATDGRFSFDDLAPGDYFLATVPDLDLDTWRTPAFLERLVDVSTRVRLSEGEQKKQDLKIVR
jgi:hypothetical protein